MNVKLKFLGAAQTVTGSKTLFTYRGKKYLIDCGLFQGPSELRKFNWQELDDLKDISAVLLTHAHIDHSGLLPRLTKQGFNGPVYCSYPTQEIAHLLLLDSAYLQEEDAYFANKTKHSRHDPALPLYTVADAEKSVRQLEGRPYHQWIQLEPGLSFRFIRSGHILGSSFIQLSFENQSGQRLLTFSGDLGSDRSLVLRPPEPLSETDYLVMEATYGDRLHPSTQAHDEIEKIIKKVIGRGGTLVIPAFAVGRSQEIIHIVHQLENDKRIDPVPVYLDSPMAQDVTKIYKKYSDELKSEIQGNGIIQALSCTHYHEVKSADDSMLLCMSDEPKIVISAAGMLTGGRVLHHLKAKLPDEKSGVLFVGYQGQGTKGLLLKNGLKNIRIHHQNVSVEAEIFTIDSLSAHADSDEIIHWLSRMSKKPSLSFLNHGEKNSLETLKYRMEIELSLKTQIAEPFIEYQI